MRTIIRYSINGETDNRLGNKLRAALEESGFGKIGTASWEHPDIDIEKLANVMSTFWDLAGNPQGAAGAGASAAVDHVWIYSDEPGS